MVVARTNGERRQARRLAHLLDVVRQDEPGTTEDTIRRAYREATDRFHAAWRDEHRTPTTSDLIRGIWDALGLQPVEVRLNDTVRIFEEGLLEGPPDFAEGLVPALEWAAGRYRLGIISDTMFSPGRVIRELLERRGIGSLFEVFVFSDETGCSKPNVRAFDTARAAFGVDYAEMAHIGDLLRTDVAGAHAAGVRAVQYTGIRRDEAHGPTPDVTLGHWDELPSVMTTLDNDTT